MAKARLMDEDSPVPGRESTELAWWRTARLRETEPFCSASSSPYTARRLSISLISSSVAVRSPAAEGLIDMRSSKVSRHVG